MNPSSQNAIKCEILPSSLILVEPTNFQINPETISDNIYMEKLTEDSSIIHSRVLQEHKNYQKKLEEYSVPVRLYKQIHENAYDSIFACDWIGTIRNEDFPDGIVFIFPLRWPTRRLERNYAIVEDLKKEYAIVEDLSFFEEKDLALESFGTMSLDLHNRIVYLNLSERCHIEPVNYFLELLNKHSKGGKYRLRLIDSADPKDGTPCFHTGLYLAFNDKTVFFCKDFVKDPADADKILEELSKINEFKYNVILLSYLETLKMCANVLEVRLPNNTKEKNGLFMSKFSADNYTKENFEKLKQMYEIIVVDMDTINTCAGGSLRCMTSAVY